MNLEAPSARFDAPPHTVPRLPTRAALVLLVSAALLVPARPGAAAPAPGDWRTLLERAAEEAVSSAYEGELLWVSWSPDGPSVQFIEVRHTTGELLVRTEQQTLSVSDEGGGVTDHAGGWYSPLPATVLVGMDDSLELLEDKYSAQVMGVDRLLGRDCDVVEVHLRHSGALRERLWLDRASGMLLRRETYAADGSRLRMAAYLSLDLSPLAVPPPAQRAATGRGALQHRGQHVIALDDHELATLRRAGWAVPAELPGGYHAREAYAMSADGSQPLQVVYHDGLYSVSLFQQRGRPDWESLPPGARQVEALDFPAYEWPHEVPARMVWEAAGSAWSLVGDAPAEELLGIVRALPQPEAPTFGERLRRGLARLWSLLTPG